MEKFAKCLVIISIVTGSQASQADVAPEQPTPVAEIPALSPKTARPAKAPALRYIISKRSFMWVRKVETNRDAGIMSAQIGIVSPLQTFILTSYNFQTNYASESRYDYRAFSESTYLFTPSLFNVGLVANHSSNSSNQKAVMRGGIYLRITGGNKRHSFGLYPTYMHNDLKGQSYRSVLLFVFNLFKGDVILDGSMTYAARAGIYNQTIDPTLSVRLYDNFRLATGYSFAKTGQIATDNIYAGFEFRRYF